MLARPYRIHPPQCLLPKDQRAPHVRWHPEIRECDVVVEIFVVVVEFFPTTYKWCQQSALCVDHAQKRPKTQSQQCSWQQKAFLPLRARQWVATWKRIYVRRHEYQEEDVLQTKVHIRPGRQNICIYIYIICMYTILWCDPTVLGFPTFATQPPLPYPTIFRSNGMFGNLVWAPPGRYDLVSYIFRSKYRWKCACFGFRWCFLWCFRWQNDCIQLWGRMMGKKLLFAGTFSQIFLHLPFWFCVIFFSVFTAMVFGCVITPFLHIFTFPLLSIFRVWSAGIFVFFHHGKYKCRLIPHGQGRSGCRPCSKPPTPPIRNSC